MSSPLRDAREHEGDRKDKSDPRSDFQRDRDRLLYTPEFHRLAGITQVSSAASRFIVHNRLTHVLEVAQVGRRLAERLLVSYPELKEILSPDVVEAACLAHDLGHPPFGHIAEEQLNECCIKNDLLDGFEGNAQTFRIVATLSRRSRDYCGLNLTRATLNAILKYPWKKGTAGKQAKKWGAYATEYESFEWVRAGIPGDGQSLEASIMDLADDIAYSVHDVLDYFKVGQIPLDRMRGDGNGELERFFTGLQQRLSAEDEFDSPTFERRKTAFIEMMETFNPFDQPFSGKLNQVADAYSMTSQLIDNYVKNSMFDSATKTIGLDQRLLDEIFVMKKLTWDYVILNPALGLKQEGQKKLIKDLFSFFSESIEKKRWHLLPTWCREHFEKDDGKKQQIDNQLAARFASDIIAGLNEKQAMDIYREISGLNYSLEASALL